MNKDSQPKKRVNNTPEYNRMYWHKMRVEKGKTYCEHCDCKVDFLGFKKHCTGLKHRLKTDPVFKKEYTIKKIEQKIEKLKNYLEHSDHPRSKATLNRQLKEAEDELENLKNE